MRMLTPLALLTLLAPAAHADRAPAPSPTASAPRAAAPAGRGTPQATGPTGPRGPRAGTPAPPPAPVVRLAPIDPASVPERCQPLAKQAVTPNLPAALSARISLASCMADQAIASLTLCDCGESIAAIDTAVAPAIAILDDLIEKADPATQIVAEHAQGELYTGFATRLLATLPRIGAGASTAEVALHDLRKQGLDAQLATWREAAMTAFQHVVELAQAHPDVANRPVVATAVRNSQQRLATEVASRAPDPRPTTPGDPPAEADRDSPPEAR